MDGSGSEKSHEVGVKLTARVMVCRDRESASKSICVAVGRKVCYFLHGLLHTPAHDLVAHLPQTEQSQKIRVHAQKEGYLTFTL